MIYGMVGLIGLGAIGTPIAHKLNRAYPDRFVMVADEERQAVYKKTTIRVNGEPFSPRWISDQSELELPLRLLIVCVKNYSLDSALGIVKKVVDKDTIILPLQNGVYSFDYFSKNFPQNIILQGYIQGPNTEKDGQSMRYTNAGELHLGDQSRSADDSAINVFELLKTAGLNVHIESDIRKMVWKKMMLNVAGNSVTALTNADYSDFKHCEPLQDLCRRAMREYLSVAAAEGILLQESDIEDVIRYYVSYRGSKRTSMLEDFLHGRKTENDYLAGWICSLALKHGLPVPLIESFYSLIQIKENLYLRNKDHDDGTENIRQSKADQHDPR